MLRRTKALKQSMFNNLVLAAYCSVLLSFHHGYARMQQWKRAYWKLDLWL